MTETVFSLRRTLAILTKEAQQLLRDQMTLRMIVLIPIMQLLLFGYALNTDPKHLPAAIIVNDSGPMTRSILAALEATQYFAFTPTPTYEDAAGSLLRRGQVLFVITIPPNFERDVMRGMRPVLLIEADASDPVAAAGALSAAQGALSHVLEREMTGPLASLASKPPAVELRTHRLYNPEGFTRYNIVPGLIGIILTMTGVMMTALSVTKEREHGTMENLLAMPVRPLEVMVGKITPYVLIGFVQGTIIVATGWLLFDIPVIGGLIPLATAGGIFIACNMAMGFTLSALAQNQIQALQMSIMITLPSIMLSGFLFPFRGMPLWAQAIGEALPATHFIRIARGVLLKGANWGEIWPDVWPLMIFFVTVSAIAVRVYRQTLD